MSLISNAIRTLLNAFPTWGKVAALGSRIQKLDTTGDLIGTVTGKLIAGASVPVITFTAASPSTETTGSLITTAAGWIVHTAVGACAAKLLCSSSAATGDYATWRIRARADAACADLYNVASVAGVNSSASANHADYPNLIGVAGLAQPNAFSQGNATNVISGLYSCMDRSGSHAGSAWSLWVDDHSTTNKAASHYLVRLSQNAMGGNPVDIDGAFTIQTSRLPVLFNFEQVQGFLTASASGSLTKTHKIAVNIAGVGVRYIEVGTIA
jgi:hypothetical protein